MAINFPQSTRSIRNDGLVPLALFLAITGLVLSVWMAWFMLARVPIMVHCPSVAQAHDGILIAHCPQAQIAQIRRGSPALVLSTTNGQRRVLDAVVLRTPNQFSHELAPDALEIFPFLSSPLPPEASLEVRIEVATLSPFALLVRGGESLAGPSPGAPSP
jgi:hypothetical protein